MKQFQFEYTNDTALDTELQKIRQWVRSHIASGVIFQIFTAQINIRVIESICEHIRSTIPDALYMGCSTNGNIVDGVLGTQTVAISCTILEFVSTKAMVLQYPISDDDVDDTMQKLHGVLEQNPWVKAIDLLVTIRGMSMSRFCDYLQNERPDIAVFGGGAFADDIDNNTAMVFSSAGKCTDRSVVFLLLGGEDIHFCTTHITGWKPLGKPFRVTRAEHSILYELDGRAAYEAYFKYLNIKNDARFFVHSLEFPFFYEHQGMNILRAPIAANPDGSLTMTSDLDENTTAHLAYGDPHTILKSVCQDGEIIRQFQPDVVKIYSCAARRTFWGDKDIARESLPFEGLAPTSGFYTSSEFLRTNGLMNQHNVTLVIAAIREGEPPSTEPKELLLEQEDRSGKISLISRLAKFIDAATTELEEANHKLAVNAVTDGLTGLNNRKEIQRIITEQLASGQTLSLVMMDLDNFKRVNDTYGHSEGDHVIIGLADQLKAGIREHNQDAAAGRWGGEEFMLMLPYPCEYAQLAAENLRTDFAAIEFPYAGYQTLSLGVTQAIPGESVDALLVRVDKALYEAKKTGKNKFVVL